MTTPNLFLETLHLLRTRPAYLTFKQIAYDTKLKESWISRLGKPTKKDKQPDHGYGKLKTLYEYLVSEHQRATINQPDLPLTGK